MWKNIKATCLPILYTSRIKKCLYATTSTSRIQSGLLLKRVIFPVRMVKLSCSTHQAKEKFWHKGSWLSVLVKQRREIVTMA